MIIGKPVIKVAVMDEDMQAFAVEKAQEAMLVMYHEQVRKLDSFRVPSKNL